MSKHKILKKLSISISALALMAPMILASNTNANAKSHYKTHYSRVNRKRKPRTHKNHKKVRKNSKKRTNKRKSRKAKRTRKHYKKHNVKHHKSSIRRYKHGVWVQSVPAYQDTVASPCAYIYNLNKRGVIKGYLMPGKNILVNGYVYQHHMVRAFRAKYHHRTLYVDNSALAASMADEDGPQFY